MSGERNPRTFREELGLTIAEVARRLEVLTDYSYNTLRRAVSRIERDRETQISGDVSQEYALVINQEFNQLLSE